MEGIDGMCRRGIRDGGEQYQVEGSNCSWFRGEVTGARYQKG